METFATAEYESIKVETPQEDVEQCSISRKLKRSHDNYEDVSQSKYIVQSTEEDEPNRTLSHIGQSFPSTSNSRASIEPLIATELRLKKIQSLRYENPLAAALLEIEVKLADQLMTLDYGEKVSHVYNPIDYAFVPHFEYYKKYCYSSAEVIMVGMNPGPFGMAQSGVPFGDVNSVVSWLGINESVGSPTKLHPKRPILGFDCKRTEASGSRLWGYFQEKFGQADNFFKRCFVYNHCPLVFMETSGKNITPAQLSATVGKKLNELCDQAILESIALFPNCKTLIGVGRFAQDRINSMCSVHSLPYTIKYLMHPSPRNPTANRSWSSLADESLTEIGLLPSQGEDTEKQPEDVKKQLF